MGLLDVIKDLIGGSGVADLAEQVGLGDQLGEVIDAVQQPIEDVAAVSEQVGDAAAPIADAAGPLLP